MKIAVFTTGGTIDKLYFDAKSEYQIGEPAVGRILRRAGVSFDYEVFTLLRKDSLEMTDDDRARVRTAVEAASCDRILITHGTDTMTDTAKALAGVAGKTIVLTGAMSPALFRDSDAEFNIGCAIGALQCLPAGVWLAMNGRVFPAGKVRKNRGAGRFEED